MGVFADSGKTHFIAKGGFYFVFVFQRVHMECCCGCFNVYKIFPSVIVPFLPKENLKKKTINELTVLLMLLQKERECSCAKQMFGTVSDSNICSAREWSTIGHFSCWTSKSTQMMQCSNDQPVSKISSISVIVVKGCALPNAERKFPSSRFRTSHRKKLQSFRQKCECGSSTCLGSSRRGMVLTA